MKVKGEFSRKTVFAAERYYAFPVFNEPYKPGEASAVQSVGDIYAAAVRSGNILPGSEKGRMLFL